MNQMYFRPTPVPPAGGLLLSPPGDGGVFLNIPPPDGASDKSRLLADFRMALAADDQLSLAYQPRIALATGQCRSVEALIRWQHPTRGHIPPGDFIPLIENTGLIAQLTDWVLNAAMAFALRLLKAGHCVRVSANVAPANLVMGYLAGRLVELVGLHGLPPSMMELEITEGALIGDDSRTRRQLAQIRRAGFAVAIDDFGAGYSNLRYFRQIPADIIKIDRSLVMDIETDPASATILQWLISLGHELGFRMVAEGLETAQTCRTLTEWGCDEGQGFFLSRPMAGPELLRWLSQRHIGA